MTERERIPRSKDDDYSRDWATQRREFIERHCGGKLEHIAHYSVDPQLLPGNIENFIGVCQVPLGIAGPLRISGEHARGDFLIPMATTEGTLVASYSRGMRAISECGGVTTTVIEQFMQRAPAFIFPDARKAREFGTWVERHFAEIKAAAESTTRIGQLTHIQQWSVARTRYLRFNYTTADAAGQNMVSKATYAACMWIRSAFKGSYRYQLSGNMDTDKKHSHLNMLHTRGTRVIAEMVFAKETLQRIMGVDTRQLWEARHISNTGAMLAGAAYNGPHSANGIAALFIATGQDEANVVESHAGQVVSELLENGDYYFSVTLPSLIVGTFGGGTALPTQRECLEILGCHGKGKVKKFAEIVAATVLAGDISLACAVLAGDWVSSHEKMGRNR